MSQNDLGTLTNSTSGPSLVTLLNNWRTALHSTHAGSSRPSYAVASMVWVKTVSATAHEIYYYDGTDDILMGTVNPTTNVFSPATSGFGTGVGTFLATPSSANFATMITDEVGTGSVVLGTSGTWTPADNSGAGLSFTNVSGQYRKVGNIVVCTGRLTYPATASGAAAGISGLPFTTQNFAVNGTVSIAYTDRGTMFMGLLNASSTSWAWYELSGGSTTNANLSGKDIRFTVIFIATT